VQLKLVQQVIGRRISGFASDQMPRDLFNVEIGNFPGAIRFLSVTAHPKWVDLLELS
jgi:hypothetical protein